MGKIGGWAGRRWVGDRLATVGRWIDGWWEGGRLG